MNIPKELREELEAEMRELHQAYYTLKEERRKRPESRALKAQSDGVKLRYQFLKQHLDPPGEEKQAPDAAAGKTASPDDSLHGQMPDYLKVDQELLSPVVQAEERVLARRAPLIDLEEITDTLKTTRGCLGAIVIGSTLAFVIALAAAYFGMGMRTFVVPTGAMVPTIEAQDRVVTFPESSYRIGDVIVFEKAENRSGYSVKRIVGLPGDTLRVHQGQLLRNGSPVFESYIKEPMDFTMEQTKVEPGEVLVMGDNRNGQEDGPHAHAGIPVESIVGRVSYVLLPFARMGSPG